MAVSKLTECKDETSACVSMPDGPPTPRAERHHRRDARLKWADRGFSLVNIHLTAQWWMWPLRHSAPVNLKSLDKAVSQAATSPPPFLWVSPLSVRPQCKSHCPPRCTCPACLTATPPLSSTSTGAPPAGRRAPSTWWTTGSMQPR